MNTTFRVIAAAGVLGLLGAALGAFAQTKTQTQPQTKTQTPTQATGRPDAPEIARTLVQTCAGIRYGESVWIAGGARDQELLEEIAVEVRRLGGHPVITLGSDRLTRRLFTDVPAEFDGQNPEFAMKLAEVIDAEIGIDFSERPDLLADIPAERLTAREKAHLPVYRKMLERGVPQVHLGNGLYPTPALARQFGVGPEELSRIFWNGVNVDYENLQAVGEQVRNALSAGRTVRIKAPNGTDLTVRIDDRPAFVSDGVIGSEDRYARGPACQVWLPAGEVYVTPVPGTATGTFVADSFFHEGRFIEALTLNFKDGKLTSFTAKGDISALRARYDAAPAGRDEFAAIDIGINPSVKAPSNNRMVTWMAAGTITVGVGENVWAGGDNSVPFGLFAHLPAGTLTVDGKELVVNGKLAVR